MFYLFVEMTCKHASSLPRRHALVIAAPRRLFRQGAPQGHVVQLEGGVERQTLPGVGVGQGAAMVLLKGLSIIDHDVINSRIASYDSINHMTL